MNKASLPLEHREISVAANDLFAFGTFDDHPNQVGFVCEKVVDGVRQRRAIFFPYDSMDIAQLAQGLMEIAGIQQISVGKKGGNIRFGPSSSQKVWNAVKDSGQV